MATAKNTKAASLKPIATPTPKVQVSYVSLTGRQPVDRESGYRANTARDLYWQAIQKLAGKTLNEVCTELESNPPKVPKSGKVEPGTGWIKFFERQGLIKVLQRLEPAKAA
jgi:hypothetical protein